MLLRNEEGVALVLAILITVALFVLGSALAFITRTDVNISSHQTQYVDAMYVAEAGVEEALQRLELKDPSYVTVNGSSINAAIRDASNPPDPNWTARIYLCRPGSQPSATTHHLNTVTVQNSDGWLEYSSPDDTTEVLTIQHKWRDRNGDGVRDANEVVLYDGGSIPPENFVKGSPVEVITAVGRSGTAERSIKVEATRLPLNVNVKAAVMSDLGVDLRGNVTICGHNHSIDTPEHTGLTDCNDWDHPHGGTCVEAGCLNAVLTTGDPVLVKGSTDAAGYPSQWDTSSTNTFYTLAQTLGLSQDEVDEILSSADYTDVGQANPQDGITYVDNAGGSQAMWNNGSGSGLLYVTGDFRTTGNFIWRGLIYVEGDLVMHGTVWVLGAVVVKGVSEYADFSAGTPKVLYSSDALDYYLRQHIKFVKVGWKEVSGL
jgi:PilX N-terminal